MAPILQLVLTAFLEYLASNAEEIIRAVRDHFGKVSEEPEVKTALNEFGHNPTTDNLEKIKTALEVHGEDGTKVASLLVNKANVQV